MALLTIDDVENLSRADIKKIYSEYVNPGLAMMMGLLNFDRIYVKAEGCYVWDAEGQKYLDFLGAYGALNLGHNPPEVLEAIKKVSQKPNLLQATINPYAAALAHNLSKVTPGNLKHSFFCNSGAEAVEGALKTARAATRCQKIISCDGAFHGKTFGALSATGRDKYKGPFLPLVPEFETIPFGDLDALEAKLKGGNVAAFIVEPIQGEAGIIVPPKGYLKGARDLCTKYGALLVVDEIQTGLGRTGSMFACEQEDVAPDIMCVAKSLGGGVMPIGAFIATDEVWERAYSGMERCLLHTSTFGGNTLACAAGIASINAIKEKRLAERAAELGDYFLNRLKGLKEKFGIIKEVRGRGLMIGIEFEPPVKGFINRITGGVINKLYEEFTGALVAGELLNKHRIITAYTLNNPNVIRLEPPLIVTKEDIDQVVDALEDIFTRYRGFMGMTLNAIKSAASSILSK
ncbi:putrescine aminotransferase [Caldanaerovirga acetigignens]|uniref:Putrescine aminotransferase n=1 Tax=Caldanaerovirga acetigignens TaxID=447595 RepID=A0A1M7FR57_9FIRM|nr:aspartate aminotransferase family protein [Caldanaerovirga acetigignens]SHM06415.1 putrescine aminotransferase [Caldanaerovirga acetigignens]